MSQNNSQTAADEAAEAVDNVAAGIKSAAHKASGKIRKAARGVRSAAGRSAGEVEEAFEEVRQCAGRSVDRRPTPGRMLQDTLKCFLCENPKSSLLVAAALGAGLAVWWKRGS
jgi:hypothetical protein